MRVEAGLPVAPSPSGSRPTPDSKTTPRRPAQPLTRALVSYPCGCELAVLDVFAGLTHARPKGLARRCPEADSLHVAQEKLVRRLMGVPEDGPAERKIIADIGELSDSLLRHRLRQKAAASLASLPAGQTKRKDPTR